MSEVSKPHSVSEARIALGMLAAKAGVLNADHPVVVLERCIDHLEEQLETAQRELQKMRDEESERILTLELILARESGRDEQLETASDLLRRLREWDIIAGPGTPEGEFTADAPYWRSELDRVLSIPAKGRALRDEQFEYDYQMGTTPDE